MGKRYAWLERVATRPNEPRAGALIQDLTGEYPMTQRKAGYPIDYSKGNADPGKDRLRVMADTATDKVKDVAQSAEEMAGKVAEQALKYGEKAQDAVSNFK